jgi:hypothetical protein
MKIPVLLACGAAVLGSLLAQVPTARAAAAPMPPPRICVASSCVDTPLQVSVSTTTAAPASSTNRSIKFRPGHYVWPDGIPLLGTIATVKARHFSQLAGFCSNPAIRGIQIHVSWSLLENGQRPGDYSAGFALIDEYLAQLRGCNKHLMLAVHDRWFGGIPGAADVLPAYLLQSGYGPVRSSVSCDSDAGGANLGGAVIAGGNACLWTGGLNLMAKLWEPAVMDRLIALSRAYGARYDANPNFEMFLPTEESAIAVPAALGYSHAAYVAQLRRLYTATRAAWPTTALRYKLNWLGNDALTAEVIAFMAELKVVIGGPDVIPGENIQSNRVFTNQSGGFRDFRGVVPFAAEVQSPSLGGKEGTFTAQQLFNHAMDGATGILPVRPQYFVWYYNTWSGGAAQQWSTGIEPYITNTLRGQVGNGTDGTRTAPASVPCPRAYTDGCRR